MIYQAVASIQMTHNTNRVESGLWASKEQAYEELRFLVARSLPVGAAFRVVQTLKTYVD